MRNVLVTIFLISLLGLTLPIKGESKILIGFKIHPEKIDNFPRLALIAQNGYLKASLQASLFYAKKLLKLSNFLSKEEGKVGANYLWTNYYRFSKLQESNTAFTKAIPYQKQNDTKTELRSQNLSWFYVFGGFILTLLVLAIYLWISQKKQNRLLQAENKATTELNKELMENNTARNRFLSVVAHDLKNPFNAIQGFVDLLMERYEELDDNVRKEYLEIIGNSSIQVTHLLETLLEWSRSQLGVIQYVPIVFDMGQLVKDEMEELRREALTKNIKLRTPVSSSFYVKADVNMVRTILRNLANNALKFTRVDGWIEINLNRRNEWLICEVADNGIGIRLEDLNKLFDFNFNFSTPGTFNETGTGLGLVLCKEFVEKNGGEIGAKSQLGKGSSFWFSLPVAYPEMKDEEFAHQENSIRETFSNLTYPFTLLKDETDLEKKKTKAEEIRFFKN